MQHFRDVYTVRDITRKFVRSRIGKPQLAPAGIQEMELQTVRERYQAAMDANFECIQMDECLF